tara:strand:- start:1924 stop:2595 length:672 start_codon:yes stop_codon:yes gene_type:complete
MALPTSGALTLDAIHVEAGGSTGTTCSLNDTDIRGLTPGSGKTINSTQGTTIDFDDFYGANAPLIASGTSGTRTVTTGAGKSAVTTVYNGIGTTFSVFNTTNSSASWSDQDYTTATRGSFKIYDCFTTTVILVPQTVQIVVDSSAGQGITWTAFSGFRYIRLGSATGSIVFDSNAAGNGTSSNFGTQGGGASSGTNGTTWSHSIGSVSNAMPGSGNVSLHLTN